jgi:putative heme-binding domain-containing protein
VALFAQHEVSPASVEAGKRLYSVNCGICHGTDGAGIPGIHLGMGRFRQAYTDQDLARIIRSGIPGTDMPPNDVTEADAANIVAYLRTSAASATALPPGGDASRGKAVFEGKGECFTCHRVGDRGSRLGPDLTEVGAVRRPAELEQALVDPGAVVRPDHRFYRVVPRNGAAVTGRLLHQDSFTILLMDPQERLRSFSKAELREHGMVKTSQMPSYKDRLAAAEIADLVTYLASLKGIDKP